MRTQSSTASDKKVRPWHGSAFVVEALALLFFMIISLAVLMLVFSSSYDRSAQADRFSHAVALATNEAEIFAANPEEDFQVKYFNEIDGVLTALDAESAASSTSFYTVKRTTDANTSTAGTLYRTTIAVVYNNAPVYELDTSRYVSKGGVA